MKNIILTNDTIIKYIDYIETAQTEEEATAQMHSTEAVALFACRIGIVDVEKMEIYMDAIRKAYFAKMKALRKQTA